MKNSASAPEKFSKRTIIAPDRSTTRSEPRTARCTYSPIRSSLPKQKNAWSQNQKRCPEAKPFALSVAGRADKAKRSAILLDIQTVWRFFYEHEILPRPTTSNPRNHPGHSSQRLPEPYLQKLLNVHNHQRN